VSNFVNPKTVTPNLNEILKIQFRIINKILRTGFYSFTGTQIITAATLLSTSMSKRYNYINSVRPYIGQPNTNLKHLCI